MAIDLAEVTGSAAKIAKEKEKVRNINELDNDAFMRLFLEQLKNQDPTAPMETDKIITQTAQLTQVEMQEQNKKTMIEVAEAMKSTQETNKELKEFQEQMKESLEALNTGMQENAKSNV
ncbi:flagellar hook capping FlgD N-terminal domain-containing protein, partial [uncultured Helicobacter sp.]